jgi:acyl carrier protein
METKLIEFIKKDILEDQDIIIEPGTKLISSGIMDSFSLVLLQTFIEKEFGKKIPAPRITPDSFDSVNQMIEVINRF